MAKQLLPCPHCGGEAALMDSWNMRTVYCKCCGCRTAKHGEQAEARAIAAWNRHSPPESPDDSALRLGKAVMTYLAGQTSASLHEWSGLLHRQSGDRVPLHWTAGLFQVIADNYPGKPESEEEAT